MAAHTHTERIIETGLEIDAPVADVWRALTDAEWLTNWFPTEARVTPGVGGSIWNAWSEGNEQFEAAITEWDEHRRLKLVYAEPTSAEDADRAIAEGRFFPFQIAADYHLEARGGCTVLRLVHSGFAEDSDWDWQYQATTRGWRFELGGLKHFLEKHRGVARRVVQARHALGDVAFDVAWQLLLGANGMVAPESAAALHVGDRYTLRTGRGEPYVGTVEILSPPRDFTGSVENLNDARLRLKIDQSCAEPGVNDAVIFLSTYGLPEDQIAALEHDVQATMASLFATPVS